jgi:hypothetical protein
MSIEIDQVLDWRGRTVVDRDNEKIGIFDEIYLDEGTDEPAWAAVKTGPLRLRRRVVPVADAEPDGDRVRVPFTKAQVRSAPPIDSNGWIPEGDQAAILRHYGVSSDRRRDVEGAGDRKVAEPPPEGEPAAPGDEPVSGRMQLRRYTVTETVTRRSEYRDD